MNPLYSQVPVPGSLHYFYFFNSLVKTGVSASKLINLSSGCRV